MNLVLVYLMILWEAGTKFWLALPDFRFSEHTQRTIACLHIMARFENTTKVTDAGSRMLNATDRS